MQTSCVKPALHCHGPHDFSASACARRHQSQQCQARPGRPKYAFAFTVSPSTCPHMSDLQTLHKSANTLVLSLRDGIEQLEKLEQVSSRSPFSLTSWTGIMCGASWVGLPAITRQVLSHNKQALSTILWALQTQGQNHGQLAGLSSQLHNRLGELQRLAQQMDSMWRMQSLRDSSSKRDIWKHKVEQVSEEYDALSAALDKHSHRERRYAALHCFHDLEASCTPLGPLYAHNTIRQILSRLLSRYCLAFI